jgi:hypothetical protein
MNNKKVPTDYIVTNNVLVHRMDEMKVNLRNDVICSHEIAPNTVNDCHNKKRM